MRHPQLPVPIKTDNSTATGFVNGNIQLKKSKVWDMKLHWLRDDNNKQFFNVHWDRGIDNDADYFTKHHPMVHYCQQRPNFVQDSFRILEDKINSIYVVIGQRGCVNPLHTYSLRGLPYPNTDEVRTGTNASPVTSYLVQRLLLDITVVPSSGK